MMKLVTAVFIGVLIVARSLFSGRIAAKEVAAVAADFQRLCANLRADGRQMDAQIFSDYVVDLHRNGRSVGFRLYDDFSSEGTAGHSEFQSQLLALLKYRRLLGVNGADGRGMVGIHILNVGFDQGGDEDARGRRQPYWSDCEIIRGAFNASAVRDILNGTIVNYMSYWPPAVGDLTALGHEGYHVFINNNPGLNYAFESGALNEALADVFGVGFQIFYRNGSPGSLNGMRISRNDWELGGVRDFVSPSDYDQPDHMSNFKNVPYSNDHGGVHANSGIINHAFYLLSEGGQHRRLRSGPDVQGVGLEKALTIFHNSTKLMSPTTNFVEARAAFQLAAAEIYGYSSAELTATVAALDAVGIASVPLPVDPSPPPPPPPAPQPQPQPQPQPPAPSDPASPPPDVTTDPIPSPGSTSEAANKKWLVAAVAAFLGLILLFGARRKPFEDSTPVHAYAPPAADSSTAILDGRSQPVARRSHGSSAYQSTERFTAEPEVLIGGKPVSLSDRRLNSRDGEVFGRSLSFSHHRLDSQRASRRHMRIRRSRSGLIAMDLNTSNGTTLNGKAMKPMKEYSLSEGDKLRIARDLTIEVNSVV